VVSNYDNSAWFYDRLSRLIYGRALINAQVYLLQYLPPNTRILIAGGGTGWILEEITRAHPSGLQITYAEVSANMIALSKKRDTGNNQVTYINQPAESIVFPDKFDVIITAFLFDNFKEASLTNIFEHLHQSLKKDGLWLNTDFQLTGKWWQAFLLKSMLLFFKVMCRIESSTLPDIDRQFEKNGYKKNHQKTFFGDFISSTVYQNKQ
jgi:ubiquinone/menaquinone biosynthesis C-methylase UbiE